MFVLEVKALIQPFWTLVITGTSSSGRQGAEVIVQPWEGASGTTTVNFHCPRRVDIGGGGVGIGGNNGAGIGGMPIGFIGLGVGSAGAG